MPAHLAMTVVSFKVPVAQICTVPFLNFQLLALEHVALKL